MSSLQITVRSIADSPSIENKICKYFEKIKNTYKGIGNCRVVIDVEQKKKQPSKLFNIHIDLTIPGKQLVVSRKKNHNLYTAIHDGFTAIEKLLTKHRKRKEKHFDKIAFYTSRAFSHHLERNELGKQTEGIDYWR